MSHFYNCLILGSVILITGCGGTKAPPSAAPETAAHDHDHGHSDRESHPETYEEAVQQLVSMDQSIRKSFAADDGEAAHGPLHDIGHLLEDVAALAPKAGMTEEQRTAVQQVVDSLFELYGAVDDTMHGREGKSYDEVSSEIDTALETLKSVSAPTPNEASPEQAND